MPRRVELVLGCSASCTPASFRAGLPLHAVMARRNGERIDAD